MKGLRKQQQQQQQQQQQSKKSAVSLSPDPCLPIQQPKFWTQGWCDSCISSVFEALPEGCSQLSSKSAGTIHVHVGKVKWKKST